MGWIYLKCSKVLHYSYTMHRFKNNFVLKIFNPFFIFRVAYPVRADNGGYAQVVLASTCTDGLKYNTEKHACV